MARARNIKPGFFKNENLAECSPWARLCFAGLWTLADREGRLEDRPKRIKGELFSFDTIDVEPLLAELEQWGFIRRYTVNGNKFIEICSFSKHQNPHHKEVASVIPAPESPGLLPHATDTKPEALPPCMDDESETSPRFSTHECVKQGVETVLIPDSLNLIPDSSNNPPNPPGGESPKPKKSRTEKIGLQDFAAACRELGEKPVPDTDPVFAYAERIGLPEEFLRLAWCWFKTRYAEKRQAGIKGWRQTFRNAIEGNWPKYWFQADDGSWQLTTAGKQAQADQQALSPVRAAA